MVSCRASSKITLLILPSFRSRRRRRRRPPPSHPNAVTGATAPTAPHPHTHRRRWLRNHSARGPWAAPLRVETLFISMPSTGGLRSACLPCPLFTPALNTLTPSLRHQLLSLSASLEARRPPISTLGGYRRDRAQYDSREPGIHQSSSWSPRCLTGPALTALQRPVLPSIGLLHPAATPRRTERTGAWPTVTAVCHPPPHPPAVHPNPT